MTHFSYPEIHSTKCCGINELNGLQCGPKRLLAEVVEMIGLDEHTPFYLFAGPPREGHALKLKKFIEKHELGTVVTTPMRRNETSGNRLKAYIWTIDKKAIVRYYNDNLID